MADLLDPFSPQQSPDNPASPAGSNISQQWNDALGDPGVRTALLQFGLSMLQPPAWGDTFGSQAGRAIGSAGEALGRASDEDIKQQEASSKQDLRAAQATSAEARANAAAARNDASAARIGIEREKLGMAKDRLSLTQILGNQRRKIDAANSYSRYLQTRNPLDTDPTLSREDFYRKSGFGDLLGESGGSTGGTVNAEDELAKAQSAISRGANPDAVRELYRSRTGQEAPF